MTVPVEHQRCPECGTIAGRDPPPRPRWVRRGPWLITLIVAAVLVVASVLGLERYAYRPNIFVAPLFVEPALEEWDLRAIAAGRQPAPPDLIDRLLRLQPPWRAELPGEELHVCLLHASGTLTSWTSVGRPFPWLHLSHRRYFSDVFRETAFEHFDPETNVLVPRRPRWRWSGGALFYAETLRTACAQFPLLAFPALMIAVSALCAAWVQRQMGRRRRDRSRPPRVGRSSLIAALLVTNALALWTVLDVDAVDRRDPWPGAPIPGPNSPQRSSLTLAMLLDLRDDPTGGALVARAIVEALPEPARSTWFTMSKPHTGKLLAATFHHQTQLRIAGWRCGWPLMLLEFREVQHDLPVEGKLQPVIWPPRLAHWRWSGTFLRIAFDSETPDDRVRSLTADFTGFTLLLLVLLMTFWVCRGCALLAMHRMRRRRARTRKCIACGYRLAALSSS